MLHMCAAFIQPNVTQSKHIKQSEILYYIQLRYVCLISGWWWWYWWWQQWRHQQYKKDGFLVVHC